MGKSVRSRNEFTNGDDRLNCMKTIATFLHANYPNDLLMPVKVGSKHPEYPHKGDAWSWSKYFALASKQHTMSTDVCILLNDLCVVDVDDVEIARELEAAFPILLQSPCESTKKGFHYWFTRPISADELGYYDGAAQRRTHIDFKSVCATNTSGVVVIAPSTDKRWVRSLWATPLQDIPFEIMDAVATPRITARQRTLSFDDGDNIVIKESGYLNLMSYFEPFSDDILIDVVPVPCSAATFVELYHILQWNELSCPRPSRKLFKELLQVADMLGLSPKVMKRLSSGVPRFQLDMYEACPEWWSTLTEEKLWRKNGAKDDDILIDVNDDLSKSLLYETLPCMANQVNRSTPDGNMWLFPRIVVPKYDSRHVLKRHPLNTSKYPDIVLQILQRYPSKIILAGGAVLGQVSRWVENGTDFDLFIVGVDAEEATTILNEIRTNFSSKICKVLGTSNAITLLIGNVVIVQIILRLYQNIAQVLVGFDLVPSKIGAFYDMQGNFTVKVAPSWIPSMRHMAFPIDTTTWGYASVVRHLKYKKKGFQIYLPGNRRAALYDVRTGVKNKKSTHGLSALFRAEFFTMQDRWCDKGRQLSACEVRKSIRKLKYDTDYGVISKALGALAYIMRALFKKRSHVMDETDNTAYTFAICDPSKSCMAMFHPLNANIWEAYDMAHLARLLEL